MRVIRYRWLLCPLSTCIQTGVNAHACMHAYTCRHPSAVIFFFFHVTRLSFCGAFCVFSFTTPHRAPLLIWMDGNCEIWRRLHFYSMTPHALITASCVFKPLNALNLKEQQLYAAVIDRRERQVSAAPEALASKVSAQLGPGRTSLTLTLSLSFSPSLMSSSCEIRVS